MRTVGHGQGDSESGNDPNMHSNGWVGGRSVDRFIVVFVGDGCSSVHQVATQEMGCECGVFSIHRNVVFVLVEVEINGEQF